MKFNELPYGIMCSAPKLEYVFCRVIDVHKDDLVFILGECGLGGSLTSIEKLTNPDRDDFDETDW